jgi:hypothetical protein
MLLPKKEYKEGNKERKEERNVEKKQPIHWTDTAKLNQSC